jgi:hypothetical protein
MHVIIVGVTFAPLVCIECGRRSDPVARGWEAHLIRDEGDDSDEVIFFARLCAAREFGDARDRRRSQRER